jgi:ATP-binding cassette subfamily C protein LapB
MTSMEPGHSGIDPRLSFDDPLLDGLLILCKLHGATVSRASLSAGLPLNKQRLSLDLLPRAAARAGLQARLCGVNLKTSRRSTCRYYCCSRTVAPPCCGVSATTARR